MKPVVFRPISPVFRSFFDDFFRPVNGESESEFLTMPAVNVRESDAHFHLEVAAPGMQKSDFNVTVENGVLTVSAEKQHSAEDKADNYTRREFHYASFKRSFQLPEGVEEKDIKAAYKDGVLTLDLPKNEKTKIQSARTISIN